MSWGSAYFVSPCSIFLTTFTYVKLAITFFLPMLFYTPYIALFYFWFTAGGSTEQATFGFTVSRLFPWFLHGLKRGLLEVLVFLIALVLILYLPNAPFERYDYHPDLKSRIVYSFVLIAFLSVIYEYISSRFNHSLSELSKQLELAATTDPLTNLLNRRGVMQHFSERDWHSPAMLLLDIDHFKRINDQYGHDHGDAYLRLFAKTIETHLADYHCLISRWGGEEFVVILESEVEKMRVAEGLREEVSKLTMPIANDEVCTTVSIGVTVLKVGETISRAFNRSDNALYEAKLAGRNQVMFEKAGDETAT